jgi:hypothetical protein
MSHYSDAELEALLDDLESDKAERKESWSGSSARSLAEHRAWLQILDDTMRRDALIPSQNRGAARTEMENRGCCCCCWPLQQPWKHQPMLNPTAGCGSSSLRSHAHG